jgi:uncharacterized protein
MKKKTLLFVALALLAHALPVSAQVDVKPEETLPPTMTVTGRGEVSATPDQATIRLGAVAQSKDAADAQSQASHIVNRTLEKLEKMNIPGEKVTTIGLTLSPIFSSEDRMDRKEPVAAKIIAYRAHNTIRVVTDDLAKVGEIIDAGMNAGANVLEGLIFELKEDEKYKEQALSLAVRQARSKAEAIAAALGLEIAAVQEVSEGGVSILFPQTPAARAFAAEANTRVQPGQVNVEATVTIRYHIAGGGKVNDSRVPNPS